MCSRVNIFFQYNYIIGNVRAPKVVISLRSSVFFWAPHHRNLLDGHHLKGNYLPCVLKITYSQGIKGIRVVDVEMRVPNCMQNWESISRAESDIDIDPAKRNYTVIHCIAVLPGLT